MRNLGIVESSVYTWFKCKHLQSAISSKTVKIGPKTLQDKTDRLLAYADRKVETRLNFVG